MKSYTATAFMFILALALMMSCVTSRFSVNIYRDNGACKSISIPERSWTYKTGHPDTPGEFEYRKLERSEKCYCVAKVSDFFREMSEERVCIELKSGRVFNISHDEWDRCERVELLMRGKNTKELVKELSAGVTNRGISYKDKEFLKNGKSWPYLGYEYILSQKSKYIVVQSVDDHPSISSFFFF